MLSVMQKTQRMGWSSIGRVGRSIGRHGGNDPDVYGSTMCLSCKGASLQPLYLSSSISISTLLSLSGWYFSAFFSSSFDDGSMISSSHLVEQNVFAALVFYNKSINITEIVSIRIEILKQLHQSRLPCADFLSLQLLPTTNTISARLFVLGVLCL
jgi:hypothetical protein